MVAIKSKALTIGPVAIWILNSGAKIESPAISAKLVKVKTFSLFKIAVFILSIFFILLFLPFFCVNMWYKQYDEAHHKKSFFEYR